MSELTILTTSKSVRVAIQGSEKSAKIALIALHGYGQLVPFFIKKFQALDPELMYVIAPEGLHRFYLKGASGRVGASWMTKEAREQDIVDNLNYLDTVYQKYITKEHFDEVIVLGFSQGAATAARWIEHTQNKIDTFIQWAGVFPPDLEFENKYIKLKSIKHYYVVGNQDPYFSDDLSNEYNQTLWLQNHEFNPQIVHFEGKHDIDSNTLQQILNKVD